MKIPALLTAILLLSGCGHLGKSDYQRPLLSLPERWPAVDRSDRFDRRYDNWWERFDDPTLSRIITPDFTTNNSFAAAALTLVTTRVSAGPNAPEPVPKPGPSLFL